MANATAPIQVGRWRALTIRCCKLLIAGDFTHVARMFALHCAQPGTTPLPTCTSARVTTAGLHPAPGHGGGVWIYGDGQEVGPGWAGAHGGVGLRPAPHTPEQNVRPAPRAPERPRPNGRAGSPSSRAATHPANTSISVYDLTFDIEESSISIYEFELRYRRFFDIEYYLYRRESFEIEESSILGCSDIEVPTFNIEVSLFLCASILEHADFDIEVQTFDIKVTYRTRYRSLNTDLRYRRFGIRSCLYIYLVVCFDIEAWQGSRCHGDSCDFTGIVTWRLVAPGSETSESLRHGSPALRSRELNCFKFLLHRVSLSRAKFPGLAGD
jgi:hypothetical protein